MKGRYSVQSTPTSSFNSEQTFFIFSLLLSEHCSNLCHQTSHGVKDVEKYNSNINKSNKNNKYSGRDRKYIGNNKNYVGHDNVDAYNKDEYERA